MVILLLINCAIAQVVSIPDANFRTRLLAASSIEDIAYIGTTEVKIDTNNDNLIQASEAAVITELNLTASNISSLIGIQSFTSLRALYISSNQITAVNASNLSQLINFNCAYNQISSLVLNPTSLQTLDISINNISSFNFSACQNLKLALCDDNNFTTLNFGSNPLLTELTCSNNPNLNYINIKNGAMQLVGSATPWPDCWTTNNSNITSICADANEINALQTYLATCPYPVPPINSNCALNITQNNYANIAVYPNPSAGIFNLDLRNETSGYEKITVIDVLGKQILRINLTPNEINLLDLSQFSNGFYFAKLENQSANTTIQLIKN